jgi:hypothetical protein
MENSHIEKIVIGTNNTRPKNRVHSAFYQIYLEVKEPYDLGKRLLGEINMPIFNSDDHWQVLFTYGAGYQGAEIYDWFAGFLVSSAENGENFLISNNFGRSNLNKFGMTDATLGLGMSSELKISEGLDISFNLNEHEEKQIERVITAWHSLFDLDEDDDGNEIIKIKTDDGKLPKEFKKNNENCYISGPESDWEDGIGVFSDNWSLSARFREPM